MLFRKNKKWKCRICGKNYGPKDLAFLIIAGNIRKTSDDEDDYRAFQTEKTFGPYCIKCAAKMADALVEKFNVKKVI